MEATDFQDSGSVTCTVCKKSTTNLESVSIFQLLPFSKTWISRKIVVILSPLPFKAVSDFICSKCYNLIRDIEEIERSLQNAKGIFFKQYNEWKPNSPTKPKNLDLSTMRNKLNAGLDGNHPPRHSSINVQNKDAFDSSCKHIKSSLSSTENKSNSYGETSSASINNADGNYILGDIGNETIDESIIIPMEIKKEIIDADMEDYENYVDSSHTSGEVKSECFTCFHCGLECESESDLVTHQQQCDEVANVKVNMPNERKKSLS